MNKWTFFIIEMQFRQHPDPNPYLYSNSDSDIKTNPGGIPTDQNQHIHRHLDGGLQTCEQRLYFGPSTLHNMYHVCEAVLRIRIRIRIRRIRMFLGPPGSGPLVRGMDTDPDPSIIKKNSKINLDSYCFVTSF
jgi:hypothetical protein